ncbi:hypothetical protein ACFYST_02590 [Kitasatospora sp. NPDC004614]|uniref:hypothetical protein n=1 Tax=unclassified Kitasatospora TaxID=2633591 RepID=UPI0036B79754
MGDERKHYGPLENLDGRWAVGDSTLLGGRWVELRADGMVLHVGDAEGELIDWSRVTSGIRIQVGRFARGGGNAAGGGFDYPWPSKRPGIGYLFLTLRDPDESRRLTFNRHPEQYKSEEVLLAAELMASTVAAGEAHRLGDPEWLDRAVTRVAGITGWTMRSVPAELVKEALERED